MKKRLILVFLILIVVLSIIVKISISPERITGKATTQTVSMNITVVEATPSLTLYSPKNNTYLTESILINYTTNIQNIWYQLDSQPNQTITNPGYIIASNGEHTFSIFANNSQGIVSQSIYFTVNTTRLNVLYTNYNGTTKGSSEHFLNHTYEELLDLSGVILENTDSGKISFNQAINVPNDLDPSDNLVDLDTKTNISFNRIEINTTALPNFNKPATLSLYGLTFTNPRILKDGVVCPSNTCTKQSYSGKTLVFNVTDFSVYSAEETPEIPGTGQVTGTSSGAGGSTEQKASGNIQIDKEIIKVKIKPEQEFNVSFTIKNNFSGSLDFNLETNLKDLLKFSEEKFSINSKNSKEIVLIFKASNKTNLGVYSGKITIKTSIQTLEIPVILEVESQKVLFDISLDIPSEYKEIIPGNDLLLQVTIFNIGSLENVETSVNYLIKDLEGEVISSQEEKITVKDQLTFSKRINIPGTVKLGTYVAAIQVSYDNTLGTSSDIFRVVAKPSLTKKYIPYVIFAVILAIILIIIIKILKNRKKETDKTLYTYKKKIEEKSQEKENIKNKLLSLEKAYKEGYITRESYEKSKRRIKDSLK
jgi:hypothetical protein